MLEIYKKLSKLANGQTSKGHGVTERTKMDNSTFVRTKRLDEDTRQSPDDEAFVDDAKQAPKEPLT
jgi:hypothetical protein